MICVREGGKAEGVYCLEVCGDTFELSPSKYLYIPQSVLYLYCAVLLCPLIITTNIVTGLRRWWRVFKFKLEHFSMKY